jgi:hypothetical protein
MSAVTATLFLALALVVVWTRRQVRPARLLEPPGHTDVGESYDRGNEHCWRRVNERHEQ